MSMGAAKMRLGQRRRVVARVVIVMAIVTAIVAGVAIWGGQIMNLSEITWAYSDQ
jgi:hypothetical protein